MIAELISHLLGAGLLLLFGNKLFCARVVRPSSELVLCEPIRYQFLCKFQGVVSALELPGGYTGDIPWRIGM